MYENLKAIAAFLSGFSIEQARGFRELADGSVNIIGPDGRKYHYAPAQLEHAAQKIRGAAVAAAAVGVAAAGKAAGKPPAARKGKAKK